MQQQLALKLGANEHGIQQYEIGERKATYDMLIALADYFDISHNHLQGHSDDPVLSPSPKHREPPLDVRNHV